MRVEEKIHGNYKNNLKISEIIGIFLAFWAGLISVIISSMMLVLLSEVSAVLSIIILLVIIFWFFLSFVNSIIIVIWRKTQNIRHMRIRKTFSIFNLGCNIFLALVLLFFAPFEFTLFIFIMSIFLTLSYNLTMPEDINGIKVN